MTIKTLIVDDHPMVLRGIRSLLGEVPDIEIIGEAENGYMAVERALEMKPDVVLMDLSMPGMNGFEATKQILEQVPQTKVLVMSMHSDMWNVQRALESSIPGYITKNCTGEELSRAIRIVSSGKNYLSPEIKRFIKKRESRDPDKIAGITAGYTTA